MDCQALLRACGIRISMRGRGNCYDNQMVGSVFRTLKSKLLWPIAWQSRAQAENAVTRYIDAFGTPVRRHSASGFKSPVAFGRKAQDVR